MAPAQCPRQVLIWTLPAIAVLISFFWYKRKKTSLRSDPGGTTLEKSSERVDSHSLKLSCISAVNSNKVIAAFEKAKRDLETSLAIEEVAFVEDEEEVVVNKIKEDNIIADHTVLEEGVIKKDKSIELSSLPLAGKNIISETFTISSPIKLDTFDIDSSSIDKKDIAKGFEDSVIEILDSTVEVPSTDSSLNEKDLEFRQKSDIIEILSDSTISVESNCSNSPDKIDIASKKDNFNIEIPNLSEFIEERKDSLKGSTKEESCVKKVLSDTSNEVKVNGSSNQSNKVNKVAGSKKRSNKKSIKENNSNKSSKTELKENKKEDKSKENIVYINGNCSKEEKSNCKHLNSSVSTDKANDKDKMELACSRVEQSGHNSSSSTINGNEAGLEEKLASLGLESSRNSEGGERDSANHSPAEVMLASPSMSNFSDAHSEGSSDSGKGCSDIPDISTPPPQTPAGGSSVAGDLIPSVYEFIIPQYMVGRLIGRHGAFLHDIRSKTHTHIFIKRHPDTTKLKICAIEGAQQDIDGALAMIRQKFPLRRFPNLTLEKVTFVNVMPSLFPLATDQFQLQLIEGVNNDVILSSLISAGHFFLQQPMHPSYQSLCQLNMVMNTVYSSPEAPPLETPLKDAICAAPAMGGWYRAQIIHLDEDNKTVDVRFLDYGGFLTLETSTLRKIRGDLMMLPFQAVECLLAGVLPAGGEDAEWTEEARLFVQDLTCGQILQAHVSEYTETGVPMVFLYAMYLGQVVVVNNELVSRGFAETYTPPVVEE